MDTRYRSMNDFLEDGFIEMIFVKIKKNWQISSQRIKTMRLGIVTIIKRSKILKPNRKDVIKCLI